jgi:hypothetical protein
MGVAVGGGGPEVAVAAMVGVGVAGFVVEVEGVAGGGEERRRGERKGALRGVRRRRLGSRSSILGEGRGRVVIFDASVNRRTVCRWGPRLLRPTKKYKSESGR